MRAASLALALILTAILTPRAGAQYPLTIPLPTPRFTFQEKAEYEDDILLHPREVVDMAYWDAVAIQESNPSLLPFIRYVWINRVDKLHVGAYLVSIHGAMGHNPNMERFPQIGNGHLLRVNLASLALLDNDLARIRDTWEEIFDARFMLRNENLPITVTVAAKQAFVQTGTTILARAKKGDTFVSNGRRQRVGVVDWVGIVFNGKNAFIREDELEAIPNALSYSLHTDQGSLPGKEYQQPLRIEQLASMLKTRVPIVYGPNLITQMNTILYYKFRGFAGKNEDEILELVSQVKRVKERDSTSWAGMPISNVTGDTRAIEASPGANLRPAQGQAINFRTLDFKDDDDAVENAMANLLNPNPNGSEFIGFLDNGLQCFAVFQRDRKAPDKPGTLLEAVPPDVAADRITAPAPHGASVINAISCYSCHGLEDGYREYRNAVMDVYTGFSSAEQAVIIGDQSSTDDQTKVWHQLVARYKNIPSFYLENARRSLSFNVASLVRISDKDVVRQVYSEIHRIYKRHNFQPITAAVALREIGIEPGDDPIETFNRRVPKLPQNAFGVRLEHSTIMMLRTPGVGVRRNLFDSILADLYLRTVPE